MLGLGERTDSPDGVCCLRKVKGSVKMILVH